MEERKILVIDDRMDNLITGMQAVKELGFDAIGATEVKSALKVIYKEDFFLVLTDMQMREGKEAGMEIVRECCKRGIPVGIVTMTSSHGHHRGKVVLQIPFPPMLLKDTELILREVETLGSEKDIHGWKGAVGWFKKNYPQIDENLQSRKRYRKFLNKQFIFK